MADEIPAQRKNPLTGEWQTLTFRQWTLLKCGITLDKHDRVDDWTFAIIRGPIAVCSFAFGLDYSIKPYTIEWLSDQLKLFNPLSAPQIYEWAQFMCRFYNVEALEPELRRVGIEKQQIAKAKALALQYALENDKSKSNKRRGKHK